MPCTGFGASARRYLQAIFPHSLISAIHDTPDGEFAGCIPDCSQFELLEELSEAVYQQRAALGVAFDGDGDRVAFVDGEGNVLTADESAWVLLESLADTLSGEKFVYDLTFSDRVPEAAGRLGAETVVERSGDSSIRRRMRKENARFGAETSGHYFFRELDGGDDGLYAACRLIAFLAASGKELASLRQQCPEVFATPDLHVRVKSQYCQAVLGRVREVFAKYAQSEVEGVRIDFPKGWALVRHAVGKPGLVFRFEAKSWKALAKLIWQFSEALPEVGDALWARYEESLSFGEEDF